jgi:hypothetical protein
MKYIKLYFCINASNYGLTALLVLHEFMTRLVADNFKCIPIPLFQTVSRVSNKGFAHGLART